MSLGPLRRKPFFADKDRAFWVLQTAGWGAYFVLRTLSGFANGVDLLFVVPMAISTAAGYSLTLLMAASYRRLIDQKPIVTWTLSITVLMVAAVAYAMIETQAFITFYRPGERMNAPLFFGAFLLDSMLLLGWSALYYGINFYLMLEKQADQLLHLENQASSAQLAMLRYQLTPHFLFNTLNSISTLVLLKQTERANAMLSRLSSFLRYTLANEPTAQVTLAQEFETLKLYLEIEKMRFEDRLRPDFTLDPAASTALSYAGCAIPQNTGTHGVGETRYAQGSDPAFDNVDDYGGFSMANIDDPSILNAMTGYTASVAITRAGTALGLADNTAALNVTVTVTRGTESYSLTGYRFR